MIKILGQIFSVAANLYVAACFLHVTMGLLVKLYGWAVKKMSKDKGFISVDASELTLGYGLTLDVLGYAISLLENLLGRMSKEERDSAADIIGRMQSARERCAKAFARNRLEMGASGKAEPKNATEEMQLSDDLMAAMQAQGISPKEIASVERFSTEEVMEGTREMSWREEIEPDEDAPQ